MWLQGVEAPHKYVEQAVAGGLVLARRRFAQDRRIDPPREGGHKSLLRVEARVEIGQPETSSGGDVREADIAPVALGRQGKRGIDRRLLRIQLALGRHDVTSCLT